MRLEGHLQQRVLGEVSVHPTDGHAGPITPEKRETGGAAEAAVKINGDHVVPIGQVLRTHAANHLLDAVRLEEETLLSKLEAPKEVP